MRTIFAGSVVVAAIVVATIVIAGSGYAGGAGRQDATGQAGSDIVFVSAPGGAPRAGTNAAADTAAATVISGIGTDPAATQPDMAVEAALDHAGMDDRSNSRRRAMERQAELRRDGMPLDP
ncbi:hypothetical protein ACT009_01325 [Sphingomonas sp. Tas61C01]|uniref:hypothetical protein n=1 Tax=Sphingomonas sp. Tas61C01 TaxID=3458297 RepID=UPI00403EEAB7